MNPPELRALVHVFTFKAGLLARLAHDVRLSVGTFEIELQRSRVSAWFELASLRVDGAMGSAGLAPDVLSEHDKASIAHTMLAEILRADAHPRAEFSGQLRPTQNTWTLDGALQLRGISAPQSCTIERTANGVRARSEIIPSRFGIQPYAALGGAIKLKDRVLLTAEADLAGHTPEGLLESAEAIRFGAFS